MNKNSNIIASSVVLLFGVYISYVLLSWGISSFKHAYDLKKNTSFTYAKLKVLSSERSVKDTVEVSFSSIRDTLFTYDAELTTADSIPVIYSENHPYWYLFSLKAEPNDWTIWDIFASYFPIFRPDYDPPSLLSKVFIIGGVFIINLAWAFFLVFMNAQLIVKTIKKNLHNKARQVEKDARGVKG